MGGSNLLQAFPNYLICLRFIRISRVFCGMKLIVLWSVTLYVVQACNSLAYTLARACPTMPCIHLVIIILSQFQLKHMDEGPPPNAVVDEEGFMKPYHRNNRVSVLATYVWSGLPLSSLVYWVITTYPCTHAYTHTHTLSLSLSHIPHAKAETKMKPANSRNSMLILLQALELLPRPDQIYLIR